MVEGGRRTAPRGRARSRDPAPGGCGAGDAGRRRRRRARGPTRPRGGQWSRKGPRTGYNRCVLLTNGRIYTLDAAGTVVDTLVVRDGRVGFAGRRQDVNPAAGEEKLDPRGRAVLPGLVDGHAHLMLLAQGRLSLDVTGLASEEAVARRVAETAARIPRGEWIGGRGGG